MGSNEKIENKRKRRNENSNINALHDVICLCLRARICTEYISLFIDQGFFFAINNMATTWIPVLVATHTFVLTPPISDVPCADTRQATSNIERKSKENKKETKNNVSKLFGILRFFSILFRFSCGIRWRCDVRPLRTTTLLVIL